MYYFPGIKIGILGGGQLGRMLIQAAISLDVEFLVLDPDENCPCKHICHSFTKGNLLDENTVWEFGKNADIITIEIEHVNSTALEKLQKIGKTIIPDPFAIRTIQDKGLQKLFYQKFNIPQAAFTIVDDNKNSLEHLVGETTMIQKKRTLGYDGKGVIMLNKTNLNNAFKDPSLLEQRIDIDKEISVIVVKNIEGEVVCFPVVECIYNEKYNLVDYLVSPADITQKQSDIAIATAMKVVDFLQSPGIFAVEMFLTKEGAIIVNETAPRSHNSGHQSIEGNANSQFSLQIRALLNLPLGSTQTTKHSLMMNIIGSENHEGPVVYKGLSEVLKIDNSYIHLYGKKITKPGRKMGHITLLGESREELLSKAQNIKKSLSVESVEK